MITDLRNAAAGAALAGALALGAAPAEADVLSEMGRFWQGAAVNTTGPTAFHGQASGHWTLGNLYLRSPVRSEQIATVNLPSFRAGCGGIDAFAGAFSFINSDQLVAFGRAVAQNAVGFAFELALETISPVIAETMAKLRALSTWMNNQNMNSCETAQGAGGRRVVEERPGERGHLRRHRHQPGDLLRLRGGEARLRRGRQAQLDAGRRLGGDGRPSAGQRQLRLEGDPGVVLPRGRHAIGRVRDGGHRHGDRDQRRPRTPTRRGRGCGSSSRWRWTAG